MTVQKKFMMCNIMGLEMVFLTVMSLSETLRIQLHLISRTREERMSQSSLWQT